MKINRHSWFARQVFKRNPYANDECSFFRSFLMVLFSKLFIGLKFSALAIAIVGPIVFGIIDMTWPSPLLFDMPSIKAFIDSVPVIGFVVGLITIISGLVLYTIAPGALAIYLTVQGLVWLISKIVNRERKKETSALGVIGRGIKNKFDGLCRRLEVDGDYMRSDIVRGTRLLVKMESGTTVEAIVTDIQVNHLEGRTEMSLNVPQLEYDWLSSTDGITSSVCMTLHLKGEELHNLEVLPKK